MPLGEHHRRRRGRNIVLAGFLVALALLFFVATIAKMQGAP